MEPMPLEVIEEQRAHTRPSMKTGLLMRMLLRRLFMDEMSMHHECKAGKKLFFSGRGTSFARKRS